MQHKHCQCHAQKSLTSCHSSCQAHHMPYTPRVMHTSCHAHHMPCTPHVIHTSCTHPLHTTLLLPCHHNIVVLRVFRGDDLRHSHCNITLHSLCLSVRPRDHLFLLPQLCNVRVCARTPALLLTAQASLFPDTQSLPT